ncbi:MAG TPA: dihydrodipicolinate synthase family protein [Paraburkholderia sp.]|nr:dihydrodipicolinate synthase family protein [Paraburkholderia sp.]
MVRVLYFAATVSLLSGTDEAFPDCVSIGRAGGTLAGAHVCEDLLVEVQELFQADCEAQARALFACLAPVLRLLFVAPNPSAIKAMLTADRRNSKTCC